MQLFSFQKESKLQLRKQFQTKDRVILCQPTGAGKTYTACSIIKDAIDKPGSKLILVDREELMGAPTEWNPAQQWSESLDRFGIKYRYIRSKVYKDNYMPSRVYLGMVESFWARIKRNSNYLNELNIKFIVVDECHKHAFHKILQCFNGKVLGLTATPLSSSKHIPLSDYYDDIIMPVEAPDLITSGRIVGAKTFSIEHDWSGLKKKSNGEYTDESQMQHFRQAALYDGVVDHWRAHASKLQTVIYNVNIEHSIETAANFRRAGFRFEHIDGTMPKAKRGAVLRRFRDGEIQGICNVHLLTTGNDEKAIECIVLNRKVGLLSTYNQITGRGARSHRFPDGRTKPYFTCIDMGGNHERHGVFGERIDWRCIFKDPQRAEDSKTQRQNRSIICSRCGGVNPGHLTDCVYCKGALERKTIRKQNFRALLKKSPAQLKLIKEKKKDKLPAHLKNRQPSAMTYDQLVEYARIMGHNKSWIFVMMKLNKRKR